MTLNTVEWLQERRIRNNSADQISIYPKPLKCSLVINFAFCTKFSAGENKCKVPASEMAKF